MPISYSIMSDRDLALVVYEGEINAAERSQVISEVVRHRNFRPDQMHLIDLSGVTGWEPALESAVMPGEVRRDWMRQARDVAARLEVGTANVNATLLVYNTYDVPMGGIRRSGIGRRHGAAGIQRYCRQQSVVESFARGGGYEILLRIANTPARARALVRVIALWRRIPGLR